MVNAKTVGYSLSNISTNVLLPDLKRAKNTVGRAFIVAITSDYPLGPDMTRVRGRFNIVRDI
jgi:hypothetical protein